MEQCVGIWKVVEFQTPRDELCIHSDVMHVYYD